PGLILKLTPRERFVVNGVVLENGDHRTRVRIVTPNANVLRLRDALHPDEVTTPVTRVCYIAQLILAGEAEEGEGIRQLMTGIEQLSQVFTDADSRARLDAATTHVAERNFYPALKALRALMARERRMIEAAATRSTGGMAAE
ncbi:MAG: flagellar biosynthesis repressor FlbT, partial [Pseudomonadota bacterium]